MWFLAMSLLGVTLYLHPAHLQVAGGRAGEADKAGSPWVLPAAQFSRQQPSRLLSLPAVNTVSLASKDVNPPSQPCEQAPY